MAQQESPDLVLLDVRMPDLNGIQVLEQLKKAPDAPAVIMITADPQLDDVKTALKLGAYDFIGKPLTSKSYTSPFRTHLRLRGCAPRSNRCAAKCAGTRAITKWSRSHRRPQN